MAEHFMLKEGYNRVETNVPGHEKPIVVGEAGIATADPTIIAALSEIDSLKSVTEKEFSAAKKSSAGKED